MIRLLPISLLLTGCSSLETMNAANNAARGNWRVRGRGVSVQFADEMEVWVDD